MVFEIEITGEGCSKLLEYDMFQTAENFRQEVQFSFGRENPRVFNQGKLIGYDRLHKMLMAAESDPDIIQNFKREGNKIVLEVEFDEIQKTVSGVSASQSDMVKCDLPDKTCNLAKEQIPRVVSPELQKITGLAQGSFVTASAARLLTTAQYLIWDAAVIKVVGRGRAERQKLYQYLSNTNGTISKVIKSGKDWRSEKKSKYLYIAYKKWQEQFGPQFQDAEKQELEDADEEEENEEDQGKDQASNEDDLLEDSDDEFAEEATSPAKPRASEKPAPPPPPPPKKQKSAIATLAAPSSKKRKNKKNK